MGMMSLGLAQNEEVIVSAEGTDEAEAVDNLTDYLRNAG